MRRLSIAAAMALACAVAAPFGARAADMVTVSTAAGDITVARDAADRFQGFIADVVARGFHGRVHCFARGGHVRGSLHYTGHACDFAQRGWNLTVSVMYRVGDLAAKWGLRDGCTFRHRKDCGHIDTGHDVFRRLARDDPAPRITRR